MDDTVLLVEDDRGEMVRIPAKCFCLRENVAGTVHVLTIETPLARHDKCGLECFSNSGTVKIIRDQPIKTMCVGQDGMAPLLNGDFMDDTYGHCHGGKLMWINVTLTPTEPDWEDYRDNRGDNGEG